MILESINELVCNVGINTTKTTKVIGRIDITTSFIAVNTDLKIQYEYLDFNDNSTLHVGTTVITKEQQQQLYQAVKGLLPDINTDYNEWYLTLLYNAFRIEMASTFQIPVADILIK